MSELKSFHLGDVLSITTGILVSHDHVQGVYNILDWMTGESLFSHQLGRAADTALPVLKAEFPQLNDIVSPTYLRGNQDLIFEWVDMQAERYGQWFYVPKLAEGLYIPQDPLVELALMIDERNDEL